MRILIDITHPAHAQFFRPMLAPMRARGHEVEVTSRDKDVTVPLLDAFGIRHACLSCAGRTRWRLLVEMILRVWRLRREVRRFRPDALLAREGVYACQAGWLTGVPAISFDDTDDAPIQHALSFPFARRVYTDRAYRKSIGAKHRTFKGITQLAYLHPAVFEPDASVLEQAGLRLGKRLILCRLVRWTSNHDHGQHGLGRRRLDWLADQLSALGQVVISSEERLPPALEPWRNPLPPQDVHHLMAHCALYIGESATMAAECALLGVPAIHVSTRRLWYTDELEGSYGLVYNVDNLDAGLARATAILRDPRHHETHRINRDCYLRETDDLTAVVLEALDEVTSKAKRDETSGAWGDRK